LFFATLIENTKTNVNVINKVIINKELVE